MKLSEKEINKIIDFSEKNILLSDGVIAKQLAKLKLFSRYKHYSKLETFRRNISFIREAHNLRGRTIITDSDIEKINKDYPDLNSTQKAVKLKFRLKTNLNISTLRIYITNFKNYGHCKI